MELEPVISSNVAAIGFDAATGTLYVKFNAGGTYEAVGAKQSDFDTWKSAKSKGQHFNRVLKTAFTWSKIEKKGA